MARRQPEGPPPAPVVQRVRLRYAKRGRVRFASHRDFARAFERALRRAEVPMAYSAGFTPHPKISYLGAAPTGTSSEAEFLELGLAARVEPAALRARLDAGLPEGFDVLEVVEPPSGSSGGLAERIVASRWQVELPGVPPKVAESAVARLMAEESVLVERLMKDGRRSIDARAAIVSMRTDTAVSMRADTAAIVSMRADTAVSMRADTAGSAGHAILDVVVRHVTPAVRPDDVLAALRAVAGLAPAAPPRAVRLAQGPLDGTGGVGDPLAPDRSG